MQIFRLELDKNKKKLDSDSRNCSQMALLFAALVGENCFLVIHYAPFEL